MENTILLQRVIDELLKTEHLKRWSTETDEDNGVTFLKIKFVKPKQPVSDNKENICDQNSASTSVYDQNSDMHFYRKSDKRFNRDLNRVQQTNVSKIWRPKSDASKESEVTASNGANSDKSENTVFSCDEPVVRKANCKEMSLTPPKKPAPLSKPAPMSKLTPASEPTSASKPVPAQQANKKESKEEKLKENRRQWRMYPKNHRNAHLNIMKADTDQLYNCQICELSIQDLLLQEIELAHCRKCSSYFPNQKEYVCSKCYDRSYHVSANCYMSLVDIT